MKGIEAAAFQEFSHREMHEAHPDIRGHRLRPNKVPLCHMRGAINDHQPFFVKVGDQQTPV